MTSPATFDQHLLKFEKRPKMPLPMALGRILVVRRFACPPRGILFSDIKKFALDAFLPFVESQEKISKLAKANLPSFRFSKMVAAIV